MFTIVFSENDKNKLVSNGYKFINKQNVNGNEVYILSGNGSNFNFEENNIMYVTTNDINL